MSEATSPPNAGPPAGQPTPDRIMQFLWGFAPPLMLEAAIENRVFDVLDSGPKTIEQVSAETGASVRGLRGLMNGLAAFDFLRKEGDRYALAPDSAAFLVSTKPSFQGGLLRHISGQLIPSWLSLKETVRTGKANAGVNQQGPGEEFFIEFVESLFPLNYMAARTVAQVLGLGQGGTEPFRVLDIASGSGVWGIGLAQTDPRVHVTALDWPRVIEVTRRMAERMGVADRFSYISGDLREADFGTGYQAVTLGHILHSEGAEWSKALIRKTFDALAPGGTIVIAEMVANEDRTGPPHAMIFAVNMLVNTDEGDAFTFGEISHWLTEAGFVNPRLVEVPAPSPLILANRPA